MKTRRPPFYPKRKMENWEHTLKKAACKAYKIHNSKHHPWEHTLRVVENTIQIARELCPKHLRAAITAAYLHDIGRTDEFGGPKHAWAGAKIAPRFFTISFTEVEKESILFAIAHHADEAAPNGGFPTTSNYPEIKKRGLIEGVIAALWDGDRLDLIRCRPAVYKEYLSTKYAKDLLGSKSKIVYHCSETQGLKKIVPYKSTHQKKWIYATKDMVMAAAFLGRTGGDFTCQVGRDPDTRKPFICERFKGAFDIRYGRAKGSIYVLPGEKFVEGETLWSEEVVCKEIVIPLREIRIENAKKCLLQLADENKLIIKYYPDKIASIPKDDEDLVERAAVWAKKFGRSFILKEIKKYHPNLLDRVLKAI